MIRWMACRLAVPLSSQPIPCIGVVCDGWQRKSQCHWEGWLHSLALTGTQQQPETVTPIARHVVARRTYSSRVVVVQSELQPRRPTHPTGTPLLSYPTLTHPWACSRAAPRLVLPGHDGADRLNTKGSSGFMIGEVRSLADRNIYMHAGGG